MPEYIDTKTILSVLMDRCKPNKKFGDNGYFHYSLGYYTCFKDVCENFKEIYGKFFDNGAVSKANYDMLKENSCNTTRSGVKIILRRKDRSESMTPEHALQNKIRLALSPYAVMFRANVGSGVTYDGRHFDTGLPKGFSDLFGFRRSDGRAVFIEVKTPKGRVSAEQEKFISAMQSCGAIAGICRSPEDAIKLIGADEGA